MTSAVQTSLGKADTAIQNSDLADYVKNTDYATTNNTGVVRMGNGVSTSGNGAIYANTYTHEQYNQKDAGLIIGKGTLENVITGKQLTNQTTLEQSQASQDEIIAKLKADHPPIEATNTELTLQGTGDFDLELNPKGNITQETREGYNLFNSNVVKFDCTVTDGLITITKNSNDVYVEGSISYVEANKFITLQAGNYYLKSTNSNVRITLYGDNANLDSTFEQPITLNSTTNFGGVRIRSVDSSSLQNVSFNVMLSTLNVEYEPYGYKPSPTNPSPVKAIDGEYEITVSNSDNTQSQTQTIDTSPNPLYSQNDYYYKQNGNWYVHNEWGKVVLNGSEDWTNAGLVTNVRRYSTPLSGVKSDDASNPKFSNYFTYLFDYNSDTEHFYISNNGSLFLFSSYTDMTQYKNWLGTHNTQVYYPLATPTNTKITNTTLINSLEALQNMKAYQDQTNISQTHNEAQADMKINAKTIMSLRYMQSEIEELKQAILNS